MVHLFTSFTYNDPCLLVKAGRAFNPKLQKISYIYKYKYQLLKSWCLLLFFRFTYHISKTPIPLEKVGWRISVFYTAIPLRIISSYKGDGLHSSINTGSIDSPSPVPPFFLTLAVSALKKRSNIYGISSLSIPIPLSCI